MTICDDKSNQIGRYFILCCERCCRRVSVWEMWNGHKFPPSVIWGFFPLRVIWPSYKFKIKFLKILKWIYLIFNYLLQRKQISHKRSNDGEIQKVGKCIAYNFIASQKEMSMSRTHSFGIRVKNSFLYFHFALNDLWSVMDNTPERNLTVTKNVSRCSFDRRTPKKDVN